MFIEFCDMFLKIYFVIGIIVQIVLGMPAIYCAEHYKVLFKNQNRLKIRRKPKNPRFY